MPIYRDPNVSSSKNEHHMMIACDSKARCLAKLPFVIGGKDKPEPILDYLNEHGWVRVTKKISGTRYFCPDHRVVLPETQHRKKLAEFLADRVSLDEHDAVPTARVWDEFVRYVGKEVLHDPEFPIGKRDVYAAVRALGLVHNGVRSLTIDGKQTSTPIFKGISLKTTTAPEDHDQWFAKSKGGVLAKKRDIKAAELEWHRGRAARRRAAARSKPESAAGLVARFVEKHLVQAPGTKVTSDEMYESFRRFLHAEQAKTEVSKREMTGQLSAGHGLSVRKTSVRKDGKPVSITVYDGAGIIRKDELGDGPPPKPIACAAPGCFEAALDTVAGDLGWRELDGEVYCLGHAERQDADLVAATWPTRASDLDRPGPRGAEIAAPVEDDIVLGEDLPTGLPPAAGAPDEALLDEFDAMPQAGVEDDLNDIVLEGEPGYDEMVAKDKENR